MPITDKTRKLLWGRSGTRCAICKKELIINATTESDESVVADECHIISPHPHGPRHDPLYPVKELDHYDNLILLCRTHHKMVDDQFASFTPEILYKMKSDHEIWVSQKLTDKEEKPLRIRRIKQNIPEYLVRLTSGKDILNILTNTEAYLFDHDELESQTEVDLVGAFLQLAQDWGDIGDSLESIDRVQAAYSLAESLRELDNAGFFVFGGKEKKLLEGGSLSMASNWTTAILMVLRKNNSSIIEMNLDVTREEKSIHNT